MDYDGDSMAARHQSGYGFAIDQARVQARVHRQIGIKKEGDTYTDLHVPMDVQETLPIGSLSVEDMNEALREDQDFAVDEDIMACGEDTHIDYDQIFSMEVLY